MRDLVVTENITLDGVIDTAGGWFSPSAEDAEVDQSDLQAALGEQQDAADALLVGRVTFEELRGYWPEQSDDTTGITDYLNAVSKYVVSTTLDDPDWDETTVLRAWKDDIAALKAGPGEDIVTTGSIRLVHDLIAAGLVDEYRLFVYPVVLGHGRRLFEDGTPLPRLQLLETRPFRSGVVLLRYRPA
jgi:dihydrofolate reductase